MWHQEKAQDVPLYGYISYILVDVEVSDSYPSQRTRMNWSQEFRRNPTLMLLPNRHAEKRQGQRAADRVELSVDQMQMMQKD